MSSKLMESLAKAASAACLIGAATFAPPPAVAQPNTAAVAVGAADLGGVVTGSTGPEAGVWVIAETTDLPTKFAKIVVTDDRGRYVMPDLPKPITTSGCVAMAWWIRPRFRPFGQASQSHRRAGAHATAAAEYYPPIYWFSMLHVPAKTEFPVGRVETQGAWLNTLKTGGCVGCHSLGSPGTRRVPKMFSDEFHDTADAWTRRIQSGGASPRWPAISEASNPPAL